MISAKSRLETYKLTMQFNSLRQNDSPSLIFLSKLCQTWPPVCLPSFLLILKKIRERIWKYIFYQFSRKNIKKYFVIRSKWEYRDLKGLRRLSTSVSFQSNPTSERLVCRIRNKMADYWFCAVWVELRCGVKEIFKTLSWILFFFFSSKIFKV